MDITVAEEQVFQLLSTLDMEKAREKAWDKKTAVFGTGLGAIFSRPKAEEVQITYSECRYEPFWHVACQVRYVFDRTRSYSIPVSSPEVKRVTIEGVEHQVTAKPRQCTTPGIEQVEIPEDEKDPVLRQNRQVPGLREIADQEIRQGVLPEIEALVSRVVREGKNRQRGVGGR